MEDLVFDECIPPDNGQSLAAAFQTATDVTAAIIARAIRAGLESGRYVVTDGVVVIAGGAKTRCA